MISFGNDTVLFDLQYNNSFDKIFLLHVLLIRQKRLIGGIFFNPSVLYVLHGIFFFLSHFMNFSLLFEQHLKYLTTLKRFPPPFSNHQAL